MGFFKAVAKRGLEKVTTGMGLREQFASLREQVASLQEQMASLREQVPFRSATEVLLAGATNKTTPYDYFHGISDDFWFWLCTEGCRTNASVQKLLPRMPDEATQVSYCGHSGDSVLREGFQAYQIFKSYPEQQLGALSPDTRVLDFGCGWGRIIRFFLRDLPPANLFGIDPHPGAVELCKDTNRWCQFHLSNPLPPTPFADNTFDLIYSFSVFSHLPEDVHESWLAEFKRIVKPGGLVVATTREREFLAYCGDLRNGKGHCHDETYRQALANVFQPVQEWLDAYDSGRFCFQELGSDRYPGFYVDGKVVYGEACIPKGYVQKHWTKYFSLIDYVDDRARCPQNVIVVRNDGHRS